MRNPSDQDFRYIGLNEYQISKLEGWDAETREIVYNEALRLLMENDCNHDTLYDNMPL
jgi:hypothetical protein